jgi:hypothetical protein
LKGFYCNQVYDAVFDCTTPYSSYTDILAELSGPHQEEHVLLQSKETSLKDKVPNGRLTKEMRQKVIVPLLKEFFAYDIPFNGAARYSLKSSAVVEKVHAANEVSSIITAVISPIAVIDTGIWSLPFFEKCTPKVTLFYPFPIKRLIRKAVR